MAKAAIYARLSNESEGSTSIDRQRKECRDYAASHGLTVVEEFVDEGISGFSGKHRPEFERAITDRGDLPGIGQRAGHPVGVEVVEQRLNHRRADRAERSRAKREIPHPETAIAEVPSRSDRLLGEVGHSVNGLSGFPEASGWRITHSPIVTQQGAAPLFPPSNRRCTMRYGVSNLRP